MRISFTPQRRDDMLTLERTAPDRIRINGELFNFGPLPDGATIPEVPCDWIVGPVERIDGVVHLRLILPHGANPEQYQAFPEPIDVQEDGPVDIPTNSYAEETDEEISPNDEYPNGAIKRITVWYRWKQEPEVSEYIEPNEEPANVDA